VSKLSQVPAGLLQLFRLTHGGIAPQDFRDDVQPTVDVSEFYAANLLTQTENTPTPGALANLTETKAMSTVLRVHAISAQLTIGAAAATDLQISCGWSAASPGVPVAVAQLFLANTIAGQIIEVGAAIPPKVFVGSTWRFFARASGTAAGADHSLKIIATIEDYSGAQ